MCALNWKRKLTAVMGGLVLELAVPLRAATVPARTSGDVAPAAELGLNVQEEAREALTECGELIGITARVAGKLKKSTGDAIQDEGTLREIITKFVDRELAAIEDDFKKMLEAPGASKFTKWQRTRHAQRVHNFLKSARNKIIEDMIQVCRDIKCTEYRLERVARDLVNRQRGQEEVRASLSASKKVFVTMVAGALAAAIGAASISQPAGLLVTLIEGWLLMDYAKMHGFGFLFPMANKVIASQSPPLSKPLLEYVDGIDYDHIHKRYKAIELQKSEAMDKLMHAMKSLADRFIEMRKRLVDRPDDVKYVANMLATELRAYLTPMFPYLWEADVRTDLELLLVPLAHGFFTDWVRFPGGSNDQGAMTFLEEVIHNLVAEKGVHPQIVEEMEPLLVKMLMPSEFGKSRFDDKPMPDLPAFPGSIVNSVMTTDPSIIH